MDIQPAPARQSYPLASQRGKPDIANNKRSTDTSMVVGVQIQTS
jgi:hypothetical protein